MEQCLSVSLSLFLSPLSFSLSLRKVNKKEYETMWEGTKLEHAGFTDASRQSQYPASTFAFNLLLHLMLHFGG